MNLDFSKNHFELFGLAPAYRVEPARLENVYRELQSMVHPDRFAAASDAEKRISMQWSTRVNEAYQTLRDPIDRARYLLALKGHDTGEETNTVMPPEFLMQQMEWRETVGDARSVRDAKVLVRLRGEIAAARGEMMLFLARALDGERNYDAGCSLVRKLRFLDKIEEEVDDAIEAVEGTA